MTLDTISDYLANNRLVYRIMRNRLTTAVLLAIITATFTLMDIHAHGVRGAIRARRERKERATLAGLNN